jgi:hypothetical protein
MQGRKIFIGLAAVLSLLCAQALAAITNGAKKAPRPSGRYTTRLDEVLRVKVC